jgi:2-haloacid dehalogenase
MQDIEAIAFDTGGTVLDWHSGIRAALAEAGARRGLVRDWAAVTNEYRRRSLRGMVDQVSPGFNMDDVVRDVLEELVAKDDLGALTTEDRAAIARRWHALDAWPDFVPALARLRRRYPVVSFTILSVALIMDNARRNGFAWDCVISCEMLDVYKTRPEAYQRAARLLQLAPSRILMVACHNFDLVAARREGYRTAFVRRPDEWGEAGPPDPEPNPELDIVVPGFAALADALGL